MKILKKQAKHLLKIILAAAALVSPLIFLSLPAFAPTLETEKLSDSAQLPNSKEYDLNSQNSAEDEKILAKSYLVYDAVSGKTLASKAPQSAASIASLTKLMTSYLILKHGNTKDVISVKQNDTLNISPVLGLKAGDQVSVQDLLNAMLVGSANDAAKTLGSYLEGKTGKTVSELMNEEADALGMNDTHYNNPIGFDSDTNYSTAEDMKILVTALRKVFDFSQIDRLNGYSFNGLGGQVYSVKATNKLLAANPDMHAIKTGFTDDAQGAMIVCIQYGSTPEQSFIIIVLQSPQREADTIYLKNKIKGQLQSTAASEPPQ